MTHEDKKNIGKPNKQKLIGRKMYLFVESAFSFFRAYYNSLSLSLSHFPLSLSLYLSDTFFLSLPPSESHSFSLSICVTYFTITVSIAIQSPPCTYSIAMYRFRFVWNEENIRTNISLILIWRKDDLKYSRKLNENKDNVKDVMRANQIQSELSSKDKRK